MATLEQPKRNTDAASGLSDFGCTCSGVAC